MEKTIKKILVVDDDSDITKMFSDLLTESGFSVKVFNDGTKSLEYYRNSWEDVDVVILDYTMPGLDGQEVGERMLEINPDAKILVLSGKVFDIPKEFHERVFAVLGKPIGMKTLLLVINRALG